MCVCVCFFSWPEEEEISRRGFASFWRLRKESGQTLRSVWDRNVSLQFRSVAAYNEMLYSLCSQRIL